MPGRSARHSRSCRTLRMLSIQLTINVSLEQKETQSIP
jgi:hypothetical protein